MGARQTACKAAAAEGKAAGTPACLKSHLVAALAIAMAWAAGFVDTASAMVLLGVFTSHVTGNTAHFGREVAEASYPAAWHHGWMIIPFIAGLLYGASTIKIARRHQRHSSFAVSLFTELALLCVFLILGSQYMNAGKLDFPAPWLYYLVLALPAAAMGMQTVTVTRVEGLRVYTTYLTGSLSKMSENVVDYVCWLYDRTRGRFRKRIGKALRVTPRIKYFKHAWLTAGLWIAFFLGALCAALTGSRFGLYSLLAPMAVLTLAAIIDLSRPVLAADDPMGTQG